MQGGWVDHGAAELAGVRSPLGDQIGRLPTMIGIQRDRDFA
jgi:hypothetical protein